MFWIPGFHWFSFKKNHFLYVSERKSKKRSKTILWSELNQRRIQGKKENIFSLKQHYCYCVCKKIFWKYKYEEMIIITEAKNSPPSQKTRCFLEWHRLRACWHPANTAVKKASSPSIKHIKISIFKVALDYEELCLKYQIRTIFRRWWQIRCNDVFVCFSWSDATCRLYSPKGRKRDLHTEETTLSSSLEKIITFRKLKSLSIAKEVSTIYPH